MNFSNDFNGNMAHYTFPITEEYKREKQRIYKEAMSLITGKHMENVEKKLGVSSSVIEYDIYYKLEEFYPEKYFSEFHRKVKEKFEFLRNDHLENLDKLSLKVKFKKKTPTVEEFIQMKILKKEIEMFLSGKRPSEIAKSMNISMKTLQKNFSKDVFLYFPKKENEEFYQILKIKFENYKLMEIKPEKTEGKENDTLENEKLMEIKPEKTEGKENDTLENEKRDFSLLELKFVLYFLEKGYGISKISELLGRSYETIEKIIFEDLASYNYEEFLEIARKRNWEIGLYKRAKNKQIFKK